MLTKTKIYCVFCVFFSVLSFAQLKTLKGLVIATDDVEGIHILNKTLAEYTITNSDGSFEILTKANDTLLISGLKYQIKQVKVTQAILSKNKLIVFLNEKVTQLDEVVIGTLFTGNLGSDLNNLNVKAKINAKDLGIPGYYGKPKTLNERKLADADAGPMINFGGLVSSVNIHKLLNKISGRTKKLKAQVALDRKDKCRMQIKKEYQNYIFKDEKLSEGQQAEYFYFCMEDNMFDAICKTQDFNTMEQFLFRKLKTYKSNLKLNTKD